MQVADATHGIEVAIEILVPLYAIPFTGEIFVWCQLLLTLGSGHCSFPDR